MPTISAIKPQRSRENRRNIYLDGKFAFGCNLNVVAKFKLREGLSLTAEQVREIEQGEVRQDCFDRALRYLGIRLHSRAELRKKLIRLEFGDSIVDGVLDDLQRLGYVDDRRFAKTRALSAADHRKQGPRRALMELRKTGVSEQVARDALGDVYATRDTLQVARELAMKQAPRLRKLDPLVARRRLTGMLQRRGFDYEDIRPLLDEVLGSGRDDLE